ncbi:MAG: ParB/RepB/Spo0J family partition protein [Bdellovibrionales bacterium]|jgi:ParB family chromosome partitioning protein|nr:ParB/RepB/Spo0J family partition protein [Bdellovibrionales bacterium]
MPELTNDKDNKRKSLGRGLGSLLGGHQPDQNPVQKKESQAPLPQQMSQPPAMAMATEGKVWQVAIDKLQPGAFQPRQQFSKTSLEELAQSIKSNGILQPITVRKTSHPSKFEIVAGERRWRAAQIAGLHDVPVLIKTYTDKESLELAIIENIQREDLDPLEEADAYSKLIEEFQLSQQQVSEKVGKDRATIANAIRLLGLPVEAKDMIRRKEISVGHAKVLLALEDKVQILGMAKRVLNERIPVRKLEKIVQDLKAKGVTSVENAKMKEQVGDNNVTLRLIKGLSEELQRKLGTKVNIDYLNSKGKISIYFYSDEELTKIVDHLKEAHS